MDMSAWTKHHTDAGQPYYRSDFGGLVWQRSKDRRWVANSYGTDLALFAYSEDAKAHLDAAPFANCAADVSAAHFRAAWKPLYATICFYITDQPPYSGARRRGCDERTIPKPRPRDVGSGSL
jgi:hypothetical protein